MWLTHLFLCLFFFVVSSPVRPVRPVPDVPQRRGGDLRRTHAAEHAAVVALRVPLWWVLIYLTDDRSRLTDSPHP